MAKVMYSDVIVIGAGASGIAAAIEAGKRGLSVTVLEHGEKPLKKILATGNGKCNFTNRFIDNESFRGDEPSFAYEALKQFGPEDVIASFEDFGVLTLERDGYMYPANEQARTIRNALLLMAEKAGVRIVTEVSVLEVRCVSPEGEDSSGSSSEGRICPHSESIGSGKNDREKCRYAVKCSDGVYGSNSLILATGGTAGQNQGSDGSGYKIAESLGHKVISPRPALCPLMLKEDKKMTDKLAGVRTKAKVTLRLDGRDLVSFKGEIIFNKQGVSGIPVMQLSRYYKPGCVLDIDFLPDISQEELRKFLANIVRTRKGSSSFDGFDGLVNNKLAGELMLSAGIKGDTPVEKVGEKELEAFAGNLKSLRLKVTGTGDHESSQVTAGGVSTSEIEVLTMESKLCKGLYIVGELLDIDGNCGGYNLQWAFTSGVIAGRNC